MTDATDDPYLWLEDVTGERAMAWVRERNAETQASLAIGDRFEELRSQFQEALDAADRIPYPHFRGEHVYNLWQDEANPRGLWRRTTLADYRGADPDWDVLLDLDALGQAEGESWVWKGAAGLRPDYDRFLISLSPGGSDAMMVREWDLPSRSFVADGFTLAEAKSFATWIDRDAIFVGTDFGPGSMTESGYPRIVKRWLRGTPLTEATIEFEGEPEDVSVFVEHDPTPGFVRDVLGRALDFFRAELWVSVDGAERIRLDVPEDAVVDLHREWLLIRPRSDWAVGGQLHTAGTVLITPLSDYLAGGRELTVLFAPDASTAFSSYAWTRGQLILAALSDVHSQLTLHSPAADGWQQEALPGVPELSHTDILDTNPDLTDEYLLVSSGFLEPATLRYGQVGGDVEQLRQAPARFDSTGLAVRQHFVVSADGTKVPYFVVGDPDAVDQPTLLSGYGGFEIARTPGYDSITGRGWLARGGTYVVANIRGGGEYGPQWHHAAMREKRPRAFEDFAAVAGDLVERGLTSPARLGAIGGSNGGLLMGVMLTAYPQLFGAIVAEVPLFDMRRYHRLLAGASWMAEYGDPDNPADWEFLGPYSPYQNVRSGQPYPPVLVATSTKDDRVHPGHARKLVARLRELSYDVTYYENIEGGHGGAADNAQLAFRRALAYEFLWRTLAP